MVCPVQRVIKGNPKIFLGFNSIQASVINNNILQRRINQRPGSKPHHTGLLKVRLHLTLGNPVS